MTAAGRYVKWPCYLWQGGGVAEVAVLPTGGTALAVIAAADAFIGSLGNPNTVR